MAEKTEAALQIGQELVRRKLATLDQVRQCLRVQQELVAQGKEVPLGNILVARGCIGLEDLKEVLSPLGHLVLYCPACQVELTIRDYLRTQQYCCSRCGDELIFTSQRPRAASPEEREPPTAIDLPAPDSLVGRELGGCRIKARLASGGMGTVYAAEQIHLGRTVALKVLAPELAADANFVKRFLQEARAAASLNHSNIIHINDAGQAGGIFYYTMEYVQGENLSQLLNRRQRLPAGEALDIVDQVLDALQHAHQHEIVHRDIKPENIMIASDGRVKLADLGLAKKILGGEVSTVTQTGSILGTPYYMAPEQARDFRRADARSDLYSLGVTLFKVLSGQVPFEGSSPIEVMMRALEGRRPALRRLCPELPADLEALVDRMMHVDPAARFADAAAVKEAIRRVRKRHGLLTSVDPLV